MRIVFFAHPEFLKHQSMPKYARLLAEGMRAKGHLVNVLYPSSFFTALSSHAVLHKWLGYIDQYLLFPVKVKKQLKLYARDTLFVFTDQALGPWVPLVKNRPHIVHCHDFLAQLSAIDKIRENKVSRTGKLYQAYIRKGYTQAKNFISISKKTKHDLEGFLITPPLISEVVYNGLNQLFQPLDVQLSRKEISIRTGVDLSQGYVLHVGGNLYYKNRKGVIEIYNEWRKNSDKVVPLLLIGEQPDISLTDQCGQSAYKSDIYTVTGLEDQYLNAAYSGAGVLLFPSLAEGFGWPIAEAMASGCPVITTGDAPMNEVGGDAAFYIEKRPPAGVKDWAKVSALVLEQVFSLSANARSAVIENSLKNSARFNPADFITNTEQVYIKVINQNNAGN